MAQYNIDWDRVFELLISVAIIVIAIIYIDIIWLSFNSYYYENPIFIWIYISIIIVISYLFSKYKLFPINDSIDKIFELKITKSRRKNLLPIYWMFIGLFLGGLIYFNISHLHLSSTGFLMWFQVIYLFLGGSISFLLTMTIFFILFILYSVYNIKLNFINLDEEINPEEYTRDIGFLSTFYGIILGFAIFYTIMVVSVTINKSSHPSYDWGLTFIIPLTMIVMFILGWILSFDESNQNEKIQDNKNKYLIIALSIIITFIIILGFPTYAVPFGILLLFILQDDLSLNFFATPLIIKKELNQLEQEGYQLSSFKEKWFK